MPDSQLNPATVSASAFSAFHSMSGSETEIADALYIPAENKVVLYPVQSAFYGGSYCVMVSDDVRTMTGDSAETEAVLYPNGTVSAVQGEVSVISLNYYKNHTQIYSLEGITDYEMYAVTANNSKVAYQSVHWRLCVNGVETDVLAEDDVVFDESGRAVVRAQITDRILTESDTLTLLLEPSL